ncbi:hypothetical protein HK102_006256 [Quaeritorhiza haematococci]|nr:hypothetical protein HK102_006256 [Quaeritorhiza haematococci]
MYGPTTGFSLSRHLRTDTNPDARTIERKIEANIHPNSNSTADNNAAKKNNRVSYLKFGTLGSPVNGTIARPASASEALTLTRARKIQYIFLLSSLIFFALLNLIAHLITSWLDTRFRNYIDGFATVWGGFHHCIGFVLLDKFRHLSKVGTGSGANTLLTRGSAAGGLNAETTKQPQLSPLKVSTKFGGSKVDKGDGDEEGFPSVRPEF